MQEKRGGGWLELWRLPINFGCQLLPPPTPSYQPRCSQPWYHPQNQLFVCRSLFMHACMQGKKDDYVVLELCIAPTQLQLLQKVLQKLLTKLEVRVKTWKPCLFFSTGTFAEWWSFAFFKDSHTSPSEVQIKFGSRQNFALFCHHYFPHKIWHIFNNSCQW